MYKHDKEWGHIWQISVHIQHFMVSCLGEKVRGATIRDIVIRYNMYFVQGKGELCTDTWNGHNLLIWNQHDQRVFFQQNPPIFHLSHMQGSVYQFYMWMISHCRLLALSATVPKSVTWFRDSCQQVLPLAMLVEFEVQGSCCLVWQVPYIGVLVDVYIHPNYLLINVASNSTLDIYTPFTLVLPNQLFFNTGMWNSVHNYSCSSMISSSLRQMNLSAQVIHYAGVGGGWYRTYWHYDTFSLMCI